MSEDTNTIFTGKSGRTYHIEINPISVAAFEEFFEIDFAEAYTGGELSKRLTDEPKVMIAVCWQIAAPEMPAQDFAADVGDEDTFPKMVDAFFDSLMAYMPAGWRAIYEGEEPTQASTFEATTHYTNPDDREFEIVLTLQAIERLRANDKVDPFDLTSVAKICEKPLKVLAIAHSLSRPITGEKMPAFTEWASSLNCDGVDAVCRSLLAAIMDLHPGKAADELKAAFNRMDSARDSVLTLVSKVVKSDVDITKAAEVTA